MKKNIWQKLGEALGITVANAGGGIQTRDAAGMFGPLGDPDNDTGEEDLPEGVESKKKGKGKKTHNSTEQPRHPASGTFQGMAHTSAKRGAADDGYQDHAAADLAGEELDGDGRVLVDLDPDAEDEGVFGLDEGDGDSVPSKSGMGEELQPEPPVTKSKREGPKQLKTQNCDMERNQMGDYNSPHQNSKEAAVATLMSDHDGAKDHAMQAIGQSKDQDSQGASDSHLAAAKEHEKTATQLRKKGNPGDQAGMHDRAAALHRKAASMHQATMNALAAQEALTNLQSVNNQLGETMNRSEAVQFLVDNCELCGDAKTLNALPDAELRKRLGIVQKAVQNEALVNVARARFGPTLNSSQLATAIANAKFKKKGPADEEDDEDDDDEDMEHNDSGNQWQAQGGGKGEQAGGAGTPDEYPAQKKVSKVNASNQSRPMTLKQFEQTMPPAARAIWNTAKEITTNAKDTVIEQLTQHLEGETKQLLVNRLQQKDIGELRELALLGGNFPHRQQQEHEFSPGAVFGLGAGGATQTHNMDHTDEELILPIPTINSLGGEGKDEVGERIATKLNQRFG